ncbi:TB2/DP1, HVA22 family-domain-containing protein [Boletus edulis BED1]|uniref:Protein YOP1 n=1 Tax=Boletus edulis BED1 TaxID=1328754 RepID=A0AAD4C8T0_BOLED|nr:TB2/DP1, HVA22 family-domain-containing protein [Boletus edulis BED1]
MLFYLTSCIISSVLAFLYPGYASYKTLSQRPASEEDLERWLMYWSVLGCIIGIEYVAEWLVSWIPMYYLMKTLFLLYLVLPQTRGSSYIYINHLQPFLHSHESQIDATLASLKARLYAFVQERFRALWDQLAGTLRQQQQAEYAPSSGGTTVGAPPSLGDPVSGPAQLVAGLWRSYGPTLVASGAMLLSQGTAASGSAIEKAWRTPAASQIHLDATQSTRDRKRRSKEPQPQSIPAASGSFEASSRNSSDSELRARGTGRLEEVDEPSDTEGYEADGRGNLGSGSAARPTSWFGWA